MKKVIEFIKENNLIKENDNIILGISGGADSVCLLYIINEIRDTFSLNITAVHVNHSIRETAGRDEAFSKKLCEKLGIPFVSYTIDCPKISEEKKISLEEAGRNERYRLFEETGRKSYGEGGFKIAVAHHMDDLAETLLFNLSRGSGINGLASIKVKNGCIIRPLLCLTRKEIEEYLSENGISHIEDETNSDDDYARNRIRHNIITELGDIAPGAVKNMGRTAAQLGEIEDYLTIKTDELCDKYSEKSEEGILIKEGITAEHPAIVKRAIHRALIEVAGRARDIASVQIEAVYALLLAETGHKRDLIYNMEAVRDYAGVMISLKTELSEEERREILSNLTFEIKDRDFSQNIPTDLYTKWFDYDKIRNCPNVRFRQNSDYLTINDRDEKKSLSDYMINEKIPAKKRDSIPLLTDGDHVMWVVGYRISNAYKVSDDTKKLLVATYSQNE